MSTETILKGMRITDLAGERSATPAELLAAGNRRFQPETIAGLNVVIDPTMPDGALELRPPAAGANGEAEPVGVDNTPRCPMCASLSITSAAVMTDWGVFCSSLCRHRYSENFTKDIFAEYREERAAALFAQAPPENVCQRPRLTPPWPEDSGDVLELPEACAIVRQVATDVDDFIDPANPPADILWGFVDVHKISLTYVVIDDGRGGSIHGWEASAKFDGQPRASFALVSDGPEAAIVELIRWKVSDDLTGIYRSWDFNKGEKN